MDNLLEPVLADNIIQLENILKPKLVGELLRQVGGVAAYKFYIPSYQRGYRWDDNQVTDLLDDLLEFISTSSSKDQKYCLQPVVVKLMKDGSGRYEVLDGQQRLTTIFILLSRLKQNNNEIDLFSIEYETRPSSAEFLRNLDGTINDENPDYYYISKAYSNIHEWLKTAKGLKPNIATKLFDALVESVEFIWYEINDSSDAIDIFTRINIGKIPLTNAELVKAIFLSKNNLSLGYASADINDQNFKSILSLRQNAIALEWDQIEKVLQDPQVWGFIYNGSRTFETRIDYLLDLRSHKSPTEKNKYFSFKYFYGKVKAVRENKDLLAEYAKSNHSYMESEWNSLKEIYDILIEWYHDKTYNHLIGYLINQGTGISSLVDEFKANSRKDFLSLLKHKIKALINCDDISKLLYLNSKDKAKLEKILYFHNIISSLRVDDNNIHFPFEKMKDKLWTLEHIFAQNSDELREDDYVNWLEDHLDFFKTKTENAEAQIIVNSIGKLLLKKDKKIEKDEFEECFLKVDSYIQSKIQEIDQTASPSTDNKADDGTGRTNSEYDWINDNHSIANLALLDGSINSSIKNSLFDIKRRLILQKDKQGLFIPNETKKVFLKYYTSTPNHLSYWTFIDRKAYVESIKSSLTYLN